ncbi:5'-methylthioadenosine/adenosylhomocysteine nucleosidase [Myroides indicus]|uniref:adenosylhomocysteine nucleosidase n=1 Tax=Myroides indicus TaxID=1323422 RepID=A0A4V3E8D0_9FLAO|nr:5'-methylthioadenosine/adenosylhomocysteine nucleosidase [Myroides indicus]TDS58115.1 adenosylhomocysteine nucleosidase [Myroides indicus]
MLQQRIGILGAIPQEINGFLTLLQEVTETSIGGRIYYQGMLGNQSVVVVYSRIGKVAAAATVTTLLLEFGVTEIIFIGVAGAIHPNVKVGDVVIASELMQYDMDASPLRPKYEIPLLEKSYFETDSIRTQKAMEKVNQVINSTNITTLISLQELQKFDISAPTVHLGTIASGDQFFSTNKQKEQIQRALPHVLCVEMEGAAIAQVCYEFDIPFIVIRTISDNANQEATFSFQAFIEQISLVYGKEIITRLLGNNTLY